MSKILVTADWHIGSGRSFGHTDYGPGTRLADQEAVLEQIATLALREHVDLLLFCGDLWHGPKPKPWEIEAAVRPMTMLRGSVPVVAINGNAHDVVAPHLPTALEVVFGDEWHVARTPQVIEIAGVAIACLPWVSPAHFIASRNGALDRDETHATVAQLLCDTAGELRSQIGSAPAILMGHWSVSGASLPTGLSTDDLREVVLPLSELEAQGWDWIALGHIHRAQFLDRTRERIFYTGSPAVVDFGESLVDHGCFIIDTELESAQRFLLADRPFVTLDLDLGDVGTADAEQAALYCAGQPDVTDAVVRVRYEAREEIARRLDHAELTRALYDAGARKVMGIQATIIREDRARVEGLDEEVTPLAALDRYIERQEITERVANGMRERTAEWLEAAA